MLSDLVLSAADAEQLLGLRYAEWAVRAPSLEADIAAAAMGLDEIGHSRVLYGCLEPLGDDPRRPERQADPASYRNLACTDFSFPTWEHFVAANAIIDNALSVLLRAMLDGSSEVLRTRLRKMLNEERYHLLHGRSWLAQEPADLTAGPLGDSWREALELFGPPQGEVAELAAARCSVGRPRGPAPAPGGADPAAGTGRRDRLVDLGPGATPHAAGHDRPHDVRHAAGTRGAGPCPGRRAPGLTSGRRPGATRPAAPAAAPRTWR